MTKPSENHYLDANATEPLRPAVLQTLLQEMQAGGNPSSIHKAGREARARLERTREGLAEHFGAQHDNIVFTSGGTESNALAVHGFSAGRTVLAGVTEHDAILKATPAPLTIPVLTDGTIDSAALETMLAQHNPALVCIMLANNETGVINPVSEIAAICKSHGALLHVDAVQAAGRMDVRLDTLGATSIAISGHKLGGPAGIGALVMAGETPRVIPPLVSGGGQERGRRGGTQTVALAAGMLHALREARLTDWAHINQLRDRIDDAARAVGAIVCGDNARRLPNTSCLALPGVAAQTQLITLDIAGFCVSAGSACSSGKVSRSHVLDAMGMGPLAQQAIRVSLPWNVTSESVDLFVDTYQSMATRLQKARS